MDTYLGIRRTAGVLVALVGLATVPDASASTILDFETAGCASAISSSGGFTFSSNWVTECDADYASTWGNSSGAPSSVTAAGNSYAGGTDGVTISRSQPFDLVGGMASSFLVADGLDFLTPVSSSSLLIEGYLNGSFVQNLLVNFDPASGGVAGFQAFGGIDGINELRFFSSFEQSLSGGPDYWLVDNLEMADSSTPVPEPSTVMLLASGLLLRSRRLFVRAASRARRSPLPDNPPIP